MEKSFIDKQQVLRLLTLVGDFVEGLNKDREESRQRAEESRQRADEAEAVGESETKAPNYDRERENDVVSRPFSPLNLVGSWFHKLDDNGHIIWQGSVIGDIAAPGRPNVYLVELHNWVDGGSAHQVTVTLEEITSGEFKWRFYDNDEWMREASKVRSDGSRHAAYDRVESEHA